MEITEKEWNEEKAINLLTNFSFNDIINYLIKHKIYEEFNPNKDIEKIYADALTKMYNDPNSLFTEQQVKDQLKKQILAAFNGALYL